MNQKQYRDPNRVNFDPNMVYCGRRVKYTVRLTFASWDYRKTVEVEVRGNITGYDVIGSAIDNYLEQMEKEQQIENPRDDFSVLTLVLGRPAKDGGEEEDTLDTSDDENRYDEWLRGMLVAAEILNVEDDGHFARSSYRSQEDAEFEDDEDDSEEQEGDTDEDGDEEEEEQEEDDDAYEVVRLDDEALKYAHRQGYVFVLFECEKYAITPPSEPGDAYNYDKVPEEAEVVQRRIERRDEEDTMLLADEDEITSELAEEASISSYRFLRHRGKDYRIVLPTDIDSTYDWVNK